MISLYRPGTSILHRMPAGPKLLLFALLALAAGIFASDPIRVGVASVITVGLYNVSYSPSPAIADWLRPGLRTRMQTLSEHTAAIAAELGTLHLNLTAHPAATDPDMFSSDGRHGNARSDAIAVAEAVRLLGAHIATGHVSRP